MPGRLYRFDPADGMPTFDRIMSRIHPDDVEMFQRTIATATENETSYGRDVRLLFEDGTVIWDTWFSTWSAMMQAER
jgi:hypothetical protein